MVARWVRRAVAILGLLASLYGAVYGQHVVGAWAAGTQCAGRHDVTFTGMADAATQQVVLRVACITSTLRGLVAHTPVQVRLVNASTMRATVDDLMRRDASTQELARSAAALQLLGALSSMSAISAIASSKYNPDTAAEYDLYNKTLYVQTGGAKFTPLDLAVICHEYERALQDQYVDLNALLSDSTVAGLHNTDARLAREAVTEGDAFTTMLSYVATFNARQKLAFTQELQRAGQATSSDYLHDEVGFPASQGTTFITALRDAAAKGKHGAAARQAAGNGAVNQALRNPPASTAEVLDPTRYLRHTNADGPALPEPAVALGTGWTVTDSDVLGAYGIDDLLQEHADAHSPTAQAADQAAAGWQADRWVAYQHGRQSLLIWHLRFASSAAAGSFIRALSDYTAARFHTSIKAQPQLDWGTTAYALCVRQRGAEVAVAMASDRGLLPQCEQALKTLGFT